MMRTVLALTLLTSLLGFNTWVDALETSEIPNINEHIVTVGIRTDSPPWSYRGEHSQVGLFLDYTERLFKSLPSYSYEYILYSSYPRMVQAINAAHIDITFVYKTTDFGLLTFPKVQCSDAISEKMSYGFYALKERGIDPVTDISKVSHYRLAIGRSTERNRFPDFDQQLLTQHIKISDIYKMLKAQRSDIALLSNFNVSHWQQEFDQSFVEVLRLGTYTVHICFSEQSLSNNAIESLTEAIKKQPKLAPFEVSPSP